MGYPPGQRGYCMRSIATHHFFTSGNIIFDENIPYHSLHSLPAAPNDYSGLPFLDQRPSIVPEAPGLPPNPSNLDTDDHEHLDISPRRSPSPPLVGPVTPPRSRLMVPPSTPHPVRTRSRESSQTRMLTEKGRIFEQQIEAGKEHLAKVREAAARRGGGGNGDGDEGVSDDDDNPFVGGGFENVDSSPIAASPIAASLDADDYLQRDVDSLSEAMLLSIRSDARRNPHDEGYNMSIPPANYWEAERRTDAEEWKKVTEKELEDLKRMGVYEDVEELPEGKRAIGCRWVYKFKINESGGPPIYKARLVAQGFLQVPFVDYDATFVLL